MGNKRRKLEREPCILKSWVPTDLQTRKGKLSKGGGDLLGSSSHVPFTWVDIGLTFSCSSMRKVLLDTSFAIRSGMPGRVSQLLKLDLPTIQGQLQWEIRNGACPITFRPISKIILTRFVIQVALLPIFF